jgi:hypothetical protein
VQQQIDNDDFVRWEREAVAEIDGVDITRLTAIELIEGEDEEETKQLRALYGDAKRFITRFKWCKRVARAYFGCGMADLVGVFLFQIEPNLPTIDPHMWVVVGDIPSAYLVIDQAKNPGAALRIYIGLFREWIAAVKSGRSVETLIPANVASTEDNAERLESRLNFLEEVILPQIELRVTR